MRRSVSRNNRVLALIAAMGAASFTIGGLVYLVTDSEAANVAAVAHRLGEIRRLATVLSAALAA